MEVKRPTSAAAAIAARNKEEGSVVSFDDVKALEDFKKIPLSKAMLVTNSEGTARKVNELVLRLPSLDDMAEVGMQPYHAYRDDTGRMEIVPNMKAVRAWAVHLSGTKYTRSEIGTLGGKDAMAVYNWLCAELYGAGEGEGGNS